MAASFTATTHNMRNANVLATGDAGSIFIRIRPNWGHTDATTRPFWVYSETLLREYPSFQKFGTTVYIGHYTGVEQRLTVTADASMFTNGEWTNHLYCWDDTNNTREYFADNASKVSSTAAWNRGAPTAGLTIGNYNSTIPQENCNAALAEFGHWDRVLSAAERSQLQACGTPLCIPRGLVDYYPLFARNAAESGWRSGMNLTIASGVAAVDHPRVVYDMPMTIPASPGAAAATPWLYARRRSQIIGAGGVQ